MNSFYLIRRAARGLLAALLLLAGAGAAQAQTWQRALSSCTGPATVGSVTTTATAVTDAGDVLVAGSFGGGPLTFGTTQLSAFTGVNSYLAKWNATTRTWAWAILLNQTPGGNNLIGPNLAVNGNRIYVTGTYTGVVTVAGTLLPRIGSQGVYLAKYTDNGTGVTDGWATSGGAASGVSYCYGLAVSGNNVYIAGEFVNNSGGPPSTTFAGTSLVGDSSYGNMFLAKYFDNGTSVANGWALTDGQAGVFAAATAHAVAVSGGNVYVAGSFRSFTNVSIAGTSLSVVGRMRDVFLAKYQDLGTSYRNGWATNDGGTDYEEANRLLVSGSNLYLTGFFTSGTGVVIAGSSLPGAGNKDGFLAKYVDNGPSVSSRWATSLGSPADDVAGGVILAGGHLYVAGTFGISSPVGMTATIAGTTFTQPIGPRGEVFVASLDDLGASPANRWASRSVSSLGASSNNLGVYGSRVYVAGSIQGQASFDGITLSNPNVSAFDYLAELSDGPAPLPVSLTAFTATTAAGPPPAARLAWATASEVNSARFEVERGTDGVSFAKIGAVAAAGNSSTPRQYAWLDAAPPAGATGLYYRLRLVDQDGTATYSPVRAVRLGAAPAGLLIFPNPAAGPATFSGAAPGASILVLDALGRVVLTATADADGVALLPPPGRPGVYVARAGERASRWVVE